MMKRTPALVPGFLTLLLILPSFTTAHAQQGTATAPVDGEWRYSLSVYGYFPSLSGAASTPTSPGGPTIDVSASQIVNSLKFTFMGAFEANNGRWGVFTDLVYLDLGNSKSGTRNFTISHQAIPANTAADLSWDLKGTLWTIAGEYRVPTDPTLMLDGVAGVRMFNLKPSLAWSISGDLGPIAASGRSGFVEDSETLWDGIVGVKGRYAIDNKWSFPFYADVGTGQSRLTYQFAAGISYGFSWGELTGMWRYISYDMKSGSNVQDLSFNGPMVGATFRW